MTAKEIEQALCYHFDYRKCLMVPNVSWGFHGMHECDMTVVTEAGYLYEIEIKVSTSDLRADAKKFHDHDTRAAQHYVKGLWFAAPVKMTADLLKYVPDRAGILTVHKHMRIDVVRKPKCSDVEPLSMADRYKLASLGTLRYWSIRFKD